MEAQIDSRLRVGEAEMTMLNLFKQVEVKMTSGDTVTMNILGGTRFIGGEFRYVCHTAKRPRKPYIHEDIALHANIQAGYYMVDPMNIILK